MRPQPLNFSNIEKLRARILAKVVVTENGCWEWQGRRNAKGYGMMGVPRGNYGAHRVAYVVFKGLFSPDLLVCHHCDNPPCCNPEHLFLGTTKDNAIDASRKNRLRHCNARRGERHGAAKVSDVVVREAVARYRSGESSTSIGRSIGVSASSVQNWAAGKTRPTSLQVADAGSAA